MSVTKAEDRKFMVDGVALVPKEHKIENIKEMMSTTVRAMLQGAVTEDMVEGLKRFTEIAAHTLKQWDKAYDAAIVQEGQQGMSAEEKKQP